MRNSMKWCMRFAAVLLCLLMAAPAGAVVSEEVSESNMVAVHARPSETSGIIGWLPDGQAVTVLDSENAFYRIDCYDMTGFVHKDLVVRSEEGYLLSAVPGHEDTADWPILPMGKAEPLQQQLLRTALSLRGVPYVWGGTTPRGFDCSGFTQYVYGRSGLSLPRTCDGQLRAGMIVAKEDLQPGDIILFQNTGSARGLSHVGMYLGDGKLIHAGSRGITVVELSNSYFTSHYLCARRILLEQPEAAAPVLGAEEILFSE